MGTEALLYIYDELRGGHVIIYIYIYLFLFFIIMSNYIHHISIQITIIGVMGTEVIVKTCACPTTLTQLNYNVFNLNLSLHMQIFTIQYYAYMNILIHINIINVSMNIIKDGFIYCYTIEQFTFEQKTSQVILCLSFNFGYDLATFIAARVNTVYRSNH